MKFGKETFNEQVPELPKLLSTRHFNTLFDVIMFYLVATVTPVQDCRHC